MAKGHSLKIRVLNKHSIMINGEIKKLREIGGIRPKCFYDNYVIKFISHFLLIFILLIPKYNVIKSLTHQIPQNFERLRP